MNFCNLKPYPISSIDQNILKTYPKLKVKLFNYFLENTSNADKIIKNEPTNCNISKLS